MRGWKLGAATEGPILKLGVALGPTEGAEVILGVALGPTEGPELKLGDELGDVLPEGALIEEASINAGDESGGMGS